MAALWKNGRDRQGRQIQQCQGCRHRFTAVTGTPFSGYRFPPDIIALAVRWYLRFRLRYADVAELLAERGVRVDASAFFRGAIEATGVLPDEVTTDGAAAYSPALAATLPPVAHEVGKAVQQRIERDHQHLKGTLRPTRGFKTLAGARVLCRGHAFLRNLRAGFYDLGRLVDVKILAPRPPVAQAWAVLTAILLGR